MLEEYMKLPYTYIVKEMNDESGHYWYGKILELPGCQSDGDTPNELFENLNEAMMGYLEVLIEDGDPIPVPVKDTDYSGKFVLRLPKTLHFRLAQEAEKEGVSLNQYALFKLSQ